jgi:hypothetical protein
MPHISRMSRSLRSDRYTTKRDIGSALLSAAGLTR